MAIEWKKTAYIGLKQLSDESFLFMYIQGIKNFVEFR